MKKIIHLVFATLLIISGAGCKKYLDKKSSQFLSTFRTLEDLQAILDDWVLICMRYPSAPEIGADNIIMTDAAFNSMAEIERNRFIWSPYFVFDQSHFEWRAIYTVVNRANIVLDHINDVRQSAGIRYRQTVEGHAYFLRGYSFLKGAEVWCKAYHPDSSKTDLGIPLRLNSDFMQPTERSTASETFNQIEADLKKAAALLPDVNVSPIRPSKTAAYGALARLYLQMGDFEKAANYADSALSIKNDLLDFNIVGPEVNPARDYTFARQNKEVIFDGGSEGSGTAYFTGSVDTILYRSYSDNDLRKTYFFRFVNDVTIQFKGSYLMGSPFSGLTTAEMYLIRAESRARRGQIQSALEDVNHLLAHRFISGTYVPLQSDDQDLVVEYILEHRRKELAFRMIRWSDIKRLNRLGYNITPRRRINGTEYVLPPNDPRYAMAIPEIVVERSRIPQNPR